MALCDFGLSSSFIDPSVPMRRSELHARQLQLQQQQQAGSAPPPSTSGGSTLAPVREIRGVSPTGGVSLDTRRGSSVREQFARVSRGQEMDDHALAERSAAVGAALESSAAASSGGGGDGAAAAHFRPPPLPPLPLSASFRSGRSRARRPVLGAKGGTSAELTGRTGSFM